MKHDSGIATAMDLVQRQAKQWGWALEVEQLALLRRYAELLANYSRANVIGTKDVRGVILEHVLDSLSCLALESVIWGGRLIDVGSGGGLPGIPLAIVKGDLDVTLLEATEKKANFLQHARDSLRLNQLNISNQRAEDAGKQPEARDSYEIAVTRALASLPVVIEYCAPFVRQGGWIVAMKGRLEGEELSAGKKAASRLGATLNDVAHVQLLPELEQKQRQLVLLRKIGPTPTGYPRRVGLAKKRPLGGCNRGE